MRLNRIWLMILLRQHALLGACALSGAAILLLLAILQLSAIHWPSAADDKMPAPDAHATAQAPLSIPPGLPDRIVGADASAPSSGAREKFFADLSARFRLAGFRIDPRNPEGSRAIIEDCESRRQWIRRRGEAIAPAVTVAGVETNGVTLATPYGPCRLALSRREAGPSQAARHSQDAGADATQPQSGGAAERLAGHETYPGTWTFRRDDLMDYYEEVRRRPERLEAVFDTLAPIWYEDETDGRQKIEGYRVEPCGEELFFAAVGLREGDVVREVNGIRMDNRFAAEELIRRFAAGDLTFAHIRMERNGEEIVQSYFLEDE